MNMREEQGRAHLGFPWPEAYLDLLPLIREQWGIRDNIYLSRELGGGKSGALVYVADVESADFTGQAILKLDTPWDPAQREKHESELHRRAITDAPDFAAQHLPRLVNSLHHKNHLAILSTIAARGLEYADSWWTCPFEEQMTVAQKVSTGLLEDWNGDYKRSAGMQTPQQLLRSWLEYRLDPNEGGRIHEFLSQNCGIESNEASLTFEGQWYPNPLAFALGDDSVPDELLIRAVVGHCHGDLHGRNLLVGECSSSDPSYYLIDLAEYRSEQFLFFDHAYLEITYLLMARGAAAQPNWDSILGHLSRSHIPGARPGLRADDLGLVELVQAIRSKVMNWIDRHEGDRLSYMESQYLLARVAAGLAFTHKLPPDEVRRMAFLYAASNLKDYIALHRLDWPRHGPQFSIEKEHGPLKRSKSVHASSAIDERGGLDAQAEAPSAQPTFAAAGGNAQGGDLVSAQDERRPRQSPIKDFFYELRRRHVVRAAGVYVIAAWIAIQATSLLAASLDLPPWTETLVTTLVMLGFPIACILAWTFEIGPEGVRPANPESPDGAPRSLSLSAADYVVTLGIVAIVVFTLGRDMANKFSPDQTGAGDQELTSIAVLPFANLNAEGDDSFADGLTIEIINVLSDTKAFRIPGVTSSFQFKGRPDDLRAIGRALNVDYIVEGSVRRAGDDLRIAVRLIRANDGLLIWSSTFSDKMKAIFVTQKKIADAIGTALSTPLDIDADILKAQRSDDPRAYELFVRGLALLEQRGRALVDGMAVLERAVSIHPDFAAAWGALSLVYNVIPTFVKEISGRPVRPVIYYRKAKEAALKAQQLDPDLPVVNHALAYMYQRERQWIAAENAYQAALLNDPDAHRVMLDYAGLLYTVGKGPKALELITRAKETDPLNELYNLFDAFLRWQSHQTEANIRAVEDIFRRVPQFREIALRIIIDHRARTGELDKARDFIEACSDCSTALRTRALTMLDAASREPPGELFEQYKDANIMGYQLLYSVGGAGVTLEAFQYYGVEAKRRLIFFTVPWTLVDVLGKRHEFKEILDDMGLVAYWRTRGWTDHCKPISEMDFECG